VQVQRRGGQRLIAAKTHRTRTRPRFVVSTYEAKYMICLHSCRQHPCKLIVSGSIWGLGAGGSLCTCQVRPRLLLQVHKMQVHHSATKSNHVVASEVSVAVGQAYVSLDTPSRHHVSSGRPLSMVSATCTTMDIVYCYCFPQRSADLFCASVSAMSDCKMESSKFMSR